MGFISDCGSITYNQWGHGTENNKENINNPINMCGNYEQESH